MLQIQSYASSIRYICLVSLIILSVTGCQFSGWRLPGIERPPYLEDEATVEEIVQVLNINTLGTQTQPGLKSWNATSASVSMPGMVSVPATIAVEAPRNLRIRVSHPLTRSELVDMGSNSNEFWVWAKSDEPSGVIHVAHDEVDVISRYFDLPLDPDWMMEVFGVVAINPAEYRREESDAGSRYIELVGQKTAPNGMQVRSMIRVDLRRGVIVRRSLHADDGTALGVAEFANHERDPHSQLMLPREIRLEVPAMQTSVTFNLKSVQLNPPPLAARLWEPPRIEGEQDVRLIDLLPPEAFDATRVRQVEGTERDSPYYPTANGPSAGFEDVGRATLIPGHDAGASLQPFARGGSTTIGLPEASTDDSRWPASQPGDAAGRTSIFGNAEVDDAPLWEPTPPSTQQPAAISAPAASNDLPVWARP